MSKRIYSLVERLRNKDRVADEETRIQLREAADTIEDLWKRLLRADPICENMHHSMNEYHKIGEHCPIEEWVREGFPKWRDKI